MIVYGVLTLAVLLAIGVGIWQIQANSLGLQE